MARSKKPKDFLKTPQYIGGKNALKEFINSNLSYPKEALEHKVEGAVDVEYFVDGLGKIKNIKILKGLGYGCDEEVIRLIGSLVYQKAVNRGLNTLTRKTLTINFHLPKKKQTKLSYQLVKEEPKNKKLAGGKKQEKLYNITLNINKK